ncbi:MAG: AtpZ/AtpI family protein [Anaerolineales bacterium]|nr:AtpZ/AtpI family protein [Anaerolineales bacterium]
MRETWIGLALVFRLSALTLGATFVPLLIGIWIDRAFGTAPFGALILIVLGILTGTVATYRTVQDAYRQIAARADKDRQDREDSRGGNL